MESAIVLYYSIFVDSDGRKLVPWRQAKQKMTYFVKGELEYGGDEERGKGTRYGNGYLRRIDVFIHGIAQTFAAIDEQY